MRGFIKVFGCAAAAAYVLYVMIGIEEPEPPTVDMSEVPADQHEAVAAATEQLFHYCPGLVKHSADIEWVKAFTDERNGAISLPREYGWRDWISFEAKVADKPESKELWQWRAQGHHLYFDVGSSGLDVSKKMAGHFCYLGHKTGFFPFS